MNRIREIREAAGLSSDQLAERVGTSGAQIRRLESGDRKLTDGWMARIAEALGCTPADLIANVVLADIEEDVELVEGDPVAAAVASRGLKVFRVLGRSVINAGLAPGRIITVDTTETGIDGLRIGDIVLVELGPDRTKVLRQFVPPGILLTNRGGAQIAINLGDPSAAPAIIGVVLPGPGV